MYLYYKMNAKTVINILFIKITSVELFSLLGFGNTPERIKRNFSLSLKKKPMHIPDVKPTIPQIVVAAITDFYSTKPSNDNMYFWVHFK